MKRSAREFNRILNDLKSQQSTNNEIQGLRAIAVMAVIMFHLDSALLPGGFLGVDFFFVLSGFLMAQVLTRDVELGGHVRIKEFYKRRLKRLLPAMFVVTLLSFPIAYFVLLPSDMMDYSASMVGVVTLTLNKMIANNIGYFSPLAETQPLLHFWSLMVEIQFYLLIPLVFRLLTRHRKVLISFLCVVVLVSLAWSQHLSFEDPKDNYFLLPSRLWQLCLGCLLFFVSEKNHLRTLGADSTRWAQNLLAVGLLPIFFAFSSELSHPGLITLVPIFVFSLLLLLIVGLRSPQKVTWLGIAPLVFIGNRSFSLYLWHFVLIVAAKMTVDSIGLMAGTFMILCSVLLSHLTYELVERPFWRAEVYQPNRLCFMAVYGFAPILIVSIGLVGFLNNGFENSWKSRVSWESARAYDLVTRAQDFSQADREQECQFRRNELSEQTIHRVEACSKELGKGTLVIGDSHAIGLWRLMNLQLMVAETVEPLVGISRGGCKPYQYRKGCSFQWFKENGKWLRDHFRQVVYVQAGASLIDDGKPAVEIINSVDGYLSDLASFLPVLWVGPRLEATIDLRDFVSGGCDVEPSQFNQKKNLALMETNEHIASLTTERNFEFLDGRFLEIDVDSSCEALYWRDSNHWSLAGITYLADKQTLDWWAYDR